MGILLSELSRRRIRSINKLIKVGRNEIVVVLRVDREKGYIDLSKRRVSPEEVALHEIKYSKAKAVHSIMRHCAETLDTDLEPLYQSIGWPLARKYGHAYDAFAKAITDEEEVFADITMSDQVKEILMTQIKRRLSPQAVKVRADFELTCFSYEGIDAIKASLFAGEAAGSTEEIKVHIRLIAPPVYVMMTSSMDKNKGLEALTKALETIKEEIAARKGRMIVKVEPHAVSEKDDNLEDELKRMEEAAKEVDGDDDSEESD